MALSSQCTLPLQPAEALINHLAAAEAAAAAAVEADDVSRLAAALDSAGLSQLAHAARNALPHNQSGLRTQADPRTPAGTGPNSLVSSHDQPGQGLQSLAGESESLLSK